MHHPEMTQIIVPKYALSIRFYQGTARAKIPPVSAPNNAPHEPSELVSVLRHTAGGQAA